MIRHKVLILIFTVILFPVFSDGQNVVPKSRADISLKNEVQNAIGKGTHLACIEAEPRRLVVPGGASCIDRPGFNSFPGRSLRFL